MTTYVLFGKYSLDALKGISAKRTEKAVDLIKKLGGHVQGVYVLLGAYDLVCIVNFPGTEEAVKASIELTKLTGITFTTNAALSVEKFDTLFGQKQK